MSTNSLGTLAKATLSPRSSHDSNPAEGQKPIDSIVHNHFHFHLVDPNICTQLMNTAYTTLSRPFVSAYNFSAQVISYPIEFTKSTIASVRALPGKLYTEAL